ncbi:MAG: 3-methyl-2-oxobutanoate hydroxymethyltransferase, partial [Myxococcota bacterium]
RGARRAQVVGDMPFMSYQSSIASAMDSAGRMIKEGGCHAIKLEGGAQHAELISRLVAAGIPVMGHIGLTPQSFHQMGGFKVQGRDAEQADQLIADAQALERAGAYSIVVEGVPSELAERITAAVSIPTIGIGAGNACDGQVLVIYDLLGMDDSFKPKFVRRYEHLATRIRTAVDEYIRDVRSGEFPSRAESFSSSRGRGQRPAESSTDEPGAAITGLYSSVGK